MVLSGKELSQIVKTQVSEKAAAFEKKFSRKPCLAVVLVGDDPASITYTKAKKKVCEEVGITHKDFTFSADLPEKSLLELVDGLNKDESVDGILIQLPLPPQIDEMTVINAIEPEKDVDGFTPANLGKMYLGEKTHIACTPKGILRILDYYKIDTCSKDVCILGRSNIVGKPMAALLMQRGRNATVTVCHSFTKDIVPYVSRADIVISAMGNSGVLKPEMIKPGAVIIDVGMNRIPDSSKKSGYALMGDIDFDAVYDKVSAITPVPGGVGPMTIAMLMENTVDAACDIRGIEADSL